MSGHDVTDPDPGALIASPPRAPSPPPRRSRRVRIVLGVAAVVVIAVIVSSFITLDEYAITPGDAQSVIPLISVGSAAHHHRGSVLLTDVELVPLRAIDYLFYRLNGDDSIVPSSSITGPLSAAQYDTEGVIDMLTARQAATVVALRTLGYATSARPNGVADYAPTSPGAPASSALAVGDVIESVGGRPTLSVAQLSAALAAQVPGRRVRVTFHPLGATKHSAVTITLGTARDDDGDEICTPAGESSALPVLRRQGRVVPCLGIVPDQLYATVGAPFPISMNAEGIIGPSAGLAFTLGLVEKLDAADLTGGAKIAATGTMSIDGTVGDVGGVAQKTVAVRRAGATVFFVPTPELAVARAHAGPHLRIFAVATLAQAIADLKGLGGRVIRPSGR